MTLHTSSMDPADKDQLGFESITIAALGIVFGDIGTSPLYALREAFHGMHSIAPLAENVLGVLSLVFWSLVIIISVKYLAFVMKADNKGEGGALALTSLAFPTHLASKSWWYKILLYLGLFGAALLIGDGIITPAISVLSAVEGLKVATPALGPYVLPITFGILGGLFFSQHHGTTKIGTVFGWVMLTWFLVIGLFGLYGVIQNPMILKAIYPGYALEFFSNNGLRSIVVLGAVFLAVTGGEALYTDMGHFGKRPIQKAWFTVAFPGLLLSYFGQGALLLSSPEKAINPFFLLAPSWALYPLVFIATMAAAIASQAVISGVFSLTRQAIQLGYAPRFRIVHTSSREIGQIYIPQINWILFVCICWLVFEFKSSSALAAAYGIAVSTTMVITTILASVVAFRRWNWNWSKVIFVFLCFFSIDFLYLIANFTKVADGGWFPLTVGAIVFTLMTTWKKGRQILMQRLKDKAIPFSKFVEQIDADPPARVKGIAVFMTSDPDGTPPALIHNVKHNRVLHETNVLLTVQTKEVPNVDADDRVKIETIDESFYRIIANYGFMETPNVRDIFRICAKKNVVLDFDKITFFLGRETLLPTNQPGMAIWREKLFAFMSRNSERATAYFDIPPHQVVELGLQVEM